MPAHDHLFTLRVPTSDGTIYVRAFDANRNAANGGFVIDVEVRQNGETIFKRGDTHCSTAPGYSIDGKHARELVLSLVAMKPGDTDSEYFDSYTANQLMWAELYGEHISAERSARYCCAECGEVGPRNHCAKRRAIVASARKSFTIGSCAVQS